MGKILCLSFWATTTFEVLEYWVGDNIYISHDVFYFKNIQRPKMS